MNNGVCFILGAAVGAVGTWLYLKKKYEDKAEEEIASVRELYNTKLHEKEKPVKEKFDVDYMENGKITAHKTDSEEWKEFVEVVRQSKQRLVSDHPYPISPEEFAVYSDYETIELHLYNDGVITDDNDELVDDDITDMIGSDFADYFGEYEENAVFIRNDERQVDYEILKEDSNYHPA